MITLDAAATTATYTDETGMPVSVSWWQRDIFNQLMVRRGAQIEVEKANEAARNNYIRELAIWQERYNNGVDTFAQPPVKPKRKLLSDTGVTGEQDFSGLPDPVYPPRTKPGNGGGALPDRTTQPTQDAKLDAIMAVVMSIAKKLGV